MASVSGNLTSRFRTLIAGTGAALLPSHLPLSEASPGGFPMRILPDRVAYVRRRLAPQTVISFVSEPWQTTAVPVSSSRERTESTDQLRPEVRSLERWLDLNA
jgi:hypothetical protein